MILRASAKRERRSAAHTAQKSHAASQPFHPKIASPEIPPRKRERLAFSLLLFLFFLCFLL
jgi:hypothetical protein